MRSRLALAPRPGEATRPWQPRAPLKQLIYDDEVIAVGLVTSSEVGRQELAIRWLEPRPYVGANGQPVELTNSMGGETGWFILPTTLAAAVGRTLIQQKATGLPGFDDKGMQELIRALVEVEELPDSMCY